MSHAYGSALPQQVVMSQVSLLPPGFFSLTEKRGELSSTETCGSMCDGYIPAPFSSLSLFSVSVGLMGCHVLYRHAGGGKVGALDGGPQCCMSILRKDNVPCHLISHVPCRL